MAQAPMTPASEAAFWCNVVVVENCWEWIGATNEAGYGKLGRRWDGKSKSLRAHRVSYEWYVGHIPPSMTLDHLCENKRCVKPSHLRIASIRENMLRGNSPPSLNLAKVVCAHGHEFNEDKNGDRRCRTCSRNRYRARVGIPLDSPVQTKQQAGMASGASRRRKRLVLLDGIEPGGDGIPAGAAPASFGATPGSHNGGKDAQGNETPHA